MHTIKNYLPVATLAGTLTGLALAGLGVEPGSIALISMGGAMLASR